MYLNHINLNNSNVAPHTQKHTHTQRLLVLHISNMEYVFVHLRIGFSFTSGTTQIERNHAAILATTPLCYVS